MYGFVAQPDIFSGVVNQQIFSSQFNFGFSLIPCNANSQMGSTWWFIPLSKWVITLVINGISGVSPLITGGITHLLSGMNHQVGNPPISHALARTSHLSTVGWHPGSGAAPGAMRDAPEKNDWLADGEKAIAVNKGEIKK